jgi:hypothetical protein
MVFNELLMSMRHAPKYLRQAEWLSIAEKQLLARAILARATVAGGGLR